MFSNKVIRYCIIIIFTQRNINRFLMWSFHLFPTAAYNQSIPWTTRLSIMFTNLWELAVLTVSVKHCVPKPSHCHTIPSFYIYIYIYIYTHTHTHTHTHVYVCLMKWECFNVKLSTLFHTHTHTHTHIYLYILRHHIATIIFSILLILYTEWTSSLIW